MTDELIAGISLVIGFLVAVPCYRWSRHKKSKKRLFIEKAQKAGNCVVGEYASSRVLPGDLSSSNPRHRESSEIVKYKYTVGGIDYYKSLRFQTKGVIGTDYPYRVNVYYDPNNPRKAFCLEEADPSQQIQSGCLTTIGMTILAMFISFHIIRSLLG